MGAGFLFCGIEAVSVHEASTTVLKYNGNLLWWGVYLSQVILAFSLVHRSGLGSFISSCRNLESQFSVLCYQRLFLPFFLRVALLNLPYVPLLTRTAEQKLFLSSLLRAIQEGEPDDQSYAVAIFVSGISEGSCFSLRCMCFLLGT